MTRKVLTLGTLLLLFTLISGCPWWPDAEPGESLGEDPPDPIPNLSPGSGCSANETEPNNEFHLANPNSLAECPNAIVGSIGEHDFDIFDLGSLSVGDKVEVNVDMAADLTAGAALFNKNQELLWYSNSPNPRFNVIPQHQTDILFLVITSGPEEEITDDYTAAVEKTPDQSRQISEQNLLLDFDGGTHGIYEFGPFDAGEIHEKFSGKTDEMVDYIFAAVQRDYEPFNVNVYFKTPTRGEIPSEPYSTVYIANIYHDSWLGQAPLDFYDRNHSDKGIVFANSFNEYSAPRKFLGFLSENWKY